MTGSDIRQLDQWCSSAGITSIDLYEGDGVGIYDELSTGYDLSTPVLLAAAATGPVLELCCGAGRVGLSLLEMGADYYGIDLSAPMLERFRQHAQTRGLAVDKRLVTGDATYLPGELPAEFALIMVPAFSMVLFDEDMRANLLRNLGSRLSTEGTVACEVYQESYYRQLYGPGNQMCSWSPQDGGGHLVSLAELRQNKEHLRFLYSRRHGDALVLRTSKWVLTGDQLAAEMSMAGFAVEDRRASLSPCAEWVIARAG